MADGKTHTFADTSARELIAAARAEVTDIKNDIADRYTKAEVDNKIATVSNDLDTTETGLQNQINNIVLTASDSGDVTAEVAQARVGADGSNHDTLKARIDAEITDITDTLDTIVATPLDITWTDGSFVVGVSGALYTESGYSYSNFVDVSAYTGCTLEICVRYGSTAGYAFYDVDKKFITGGNKNTDGTSAGTNYVKTVIVPDNAKYIRISAKTSIKSDFYIKPIPSLAEALNSGKRINDRLENVLMEHNAINILPEPTIAENTKSGITMSADNGTYTVSGTSSNVWFYNIAGSETSYPANFIEGETYHITFEPSTSKVYLRIYQFDDENPSGKSILLTNKSTTFTVPAGANGLIVRLHIGASNTVSSTTVKPFISKNPTNAQLEVTADNILDSISKIKTAIKDYGAMNLIPDLTIAENTKSGITMSADSGTYTVSGTSSAVWFYNIVGSTTSIPSDFVPGETYRLTYKPTDKYIYFRIIKFNDENPDGVDVIFTNASATFTVPTDAKGLIVRLHVANGRTVDGVVKPLISKNLSNAQLEELVAGEAPPAMLTIIDDDGHIGFMSDLLPLIESRNVSIATAITETRIGAEAKWMTWEQILDCYYRGAEVLCHTYNHDPNTSDLDVKLIEHQYTIARNNMFRHGLHNADILVYNNVTGNSEKCQEAASKVFKCAIHSSGRVINQVGAINPYYIQRIPIELDPYYYDVDQLKSLIDTNIANGGWMIWIIHTSAESWTTYNAADAMATAIDYAIEQGLPIVSADYGYKKYVARK
jgi:peptidoglycan/xylan/chitin deacetylase (PgdA/CDA1 family)